MNDKSEGYIFLLLGLIGLLTSEYLARGRAKYHNADKKSKEYKNTLNMFRFEGYFVSLLFLIIGIYNL